MINLIIQISKYLILLLMALYTLQCFTVFRLKDEEAKGYLFLRQNRLMFFMHSLPKGLAASDQQYVHADLHWLHHDHTAFL